MTEKEVQRSSGPYKPMSEGVPEITFADSDLGDLDRSPAWIKQIPGTDYREDQKDYDEYLQGFEEGHGFKRT